MHPTPDEAFAAVEQGLCPLHEAPFMMISEEETDEDGNVFVAIACSRRGCHIRGFFFPYLVPAAFALAGEHWRLLGGSRA